MKTFILGIFTIITLLLIVYGIGYAVINLLPAFSQINYSVSDFHLVNVLSVGVQVILKIILFALAILVFLMAMTFVYMVGAWAEKLINKFTGEGV